jgi:hypothetical protein
MTDLGDHSTPAIHNETVDTILKELLGSIADEVAVYDSKLDTISGALLTDNTNA